MCAAVLNMQKNLADKIKAEYAMYAEDETSAQQQPEGTAATGAGGSTQSPAQQAKKPRPIEVQVACMSRAGREPGYKKTNQDNCFAFEKYITEEQSMFGSMDGHGPHGALLLLLTVRGVGCAAHLLAGLATWLAVPSGQYLTAQCTSCSVLSACQPHQVPQAVLQACFNEILVVCIPA
jgi:hypothetical protein